MKFGYAAMGLCVLASCGGGGGGTSVQDETALAVLPNGQGYSWVEQIQRIRLLDNPNAEADVGVLTRKDIPKSKTSYSGQIIIGAVYDVATNTSDIGVADFGMSINWDRTTQEISGSISNLDILRGTGNVNDQSVDQSNLKPIMTGDANLPFVADVKFNGSVQIATAFGSVVLRKNNGQLESAVVNITDLDGQFVSNKGRTYFGAHGSASIWSSDRSSTLFNNDNLDAIVIAD